MDVTCDARRSGPHTNVDGGHEAPMMRCSTCGERLSPDTERCPTCGTAVSRAPARLESVGGPASHAGHAPQRCARCGYQGQGVPYFSRTGHVGLLVGVSLFTYGLGGLAYWLARRRHYICPNCGLGWELAARALPSGGSDSAGALAPQADVPLPTAGVKRRVLGSALILLASFLIMIGIIEVEAAAIAVGSVFGAGGSGMFFWGWKALQERRQALTTGLQRKILRLATRKGGTLTVTEVAADLNLSLPAAEKVLIQMDDGFRVRSDVTDNGILLFEFPEVMHRNRLEAGEA